MIHYKYIVSNYNKKFYLKFFMLNNEEKKKITFNMITRAEFGFYFIEHKYIDQQYNSSRPDIAWLRSVYILFSFNFELLLKSVFLLTESFIDEYEIEDKLKEMGHNIKKIGNKIGNINLKNIGIKKIEENNGDYIIKTFDKTIEIKDFIDIRYDFVGSRKKVTKITMNEDKIIQENLMGVKDILKKIKNKYL